MRSQLEGCWPSGLGIEGLGVVDRVFEGEEVQPPFKMTVSPQLTNLGRKGKPRTCSPEWVQRRQEAEDHVCMCVSVCLDPQWKAVGCRASVWTWDQLPFPSALR